MEGATSGSPICIFHPGFLGSPFPCCPPPKLSQVVPLTQLFPRLSHLYLTHLPGCLSLSCSIPAICPLLASFFSVPSTTSQMKIVGFLTALFGLSYKLLQVPQSPLALSNHSAFVRGRVRLLMVSPTSFSMV